MRETEWVVQCQSLGSKMTTSTTHRFGSGTEFHRVQYGIRCMSENAKRQEKQERLLTNVKHHHNLRKGMY